MGIINFGGKIFFMTSGNKLFTILNYGCQMTKGYTIS